MTTDPILKCGPCSTAALRMVLPFSTASIAASMDSFVHRFLRLIGSARDGSASFGEFVHLHSLPGPLLFFDLYQLKFALQYKEFVSKLNRILLCKYYLPRLTHERPGGCDRNRSKPGIKPEDCRARLR